MKSTVQERKQMIYNLLDEGKTPYQVRDEMAKQFPGMKPRSILQNVYSFRSNRRRDERRNHASNGASNNGTLDPVQPGTFPHLDRFLALLYKIDSLISSEMR